MCFYARKVNLKNWMLSASPTVAQWHLLIDSVLPVYKLTYMGCKFPQKFRMHGLWPDPLIFNSMSLEGRPGDLPAIGIHLLDFSMGGLWLDVHQAVGPKMLAVQSMYIFQWWFSHILFFTYSSPLLFLLPHPCSPLF